MMGHTSGDQNKLYYDICLEDYVPKKHLLRGIDRYLDLSDLRRHLTPFYSHTGRPSVDPELMVRILLRHTLGASVVRRSPGQPGLSMVLSAGPR